MFDKLVESASTGADLGPRRRIFAASFFFVAVLFATAVIASIYAADFDLGSDNFDIAQILTPIAETEPPVEPEPVRAQLQRDPSNTSEQLTRVMNILRIEENPITPTAISTERSRYLTRPEGSFILTPRGEDGNGPPPDVGRDIPTGSSSSSAALLPDGEDRSPKELPPAPPKIEKPKPLVSGGVMTGKAVALPQPAYPATARAVGAQGIVTVQITVDESGKVISAKAIDGNPLLRAAAVTAAWKARFNPTTLTGVPVKVTGVITYNFKR